MPRLGSSVPPNNSIESSQIQDGAIVGADLALASVSGNTIAAGAILGGHIANNAISGNVIGTGFISQGHIGNNEINNAKLALASISGNVIQANSITAGHLAAGAASATVDSTGSVPLTNARCVSLALHSVSGIGYFDMVDTSTGAPYVCPSGKIALIGQMSSFNNHNANSDIFVALKNGGNYYQIMASQTVSAASAGTFTIVLGTALTSGESIAFSITRPSMSVWMNAIECDSTVGLKCPKILRIPIVGDNTLYTCPQGKTALVLNSSRLQSNAQGSIFVFNNSGGTRTIYAHAVTSGLPGLTNRITDPAGSFGAGAVATLNANVSLKPGDYLNVNTNSVAGIQTAWTQIIEI